MQLWKPVEWDPAKNKLLKEERGVSFEDVENAIEQDCLLEIIPNRTRYAHQKVFIVLIRSYVYGVPFVEDAHKIFLKTIIPNSEATKRYLSK